MTTPRLAAVLLLLSLAVACRPNTRSTTASPFPEASDAPGWTKTGATRVFEAADLWKYINGDAERYLQAGVQRTFTSAYRYGPHTEAVVDIHQMTSAEGARKIFEAEDHGGGQPVAVGDAARLYQSALLFRKGPYLVRIVAYQQHPDLQKAVLDLGRAIEKRLGQR